MSRWNISVIFFLGVSGQRRELRFSEDSVNIITGASGTGKSTLIKTIDYCLGSSKCELPAHVRRRTLAVGTKWNRGDVEILAGRIVPPVGQQTSTRMFFESGRDLPLPESVEAFEGSTTIQAAKVDLEQAFGVGDLSAEADAEDSTPGRATVRHITPYIFVTKEVIYSESILLHGLEKPDKAKDIIATLPYFLRVSDEASVIAERQLRRLRRALRKEESTAQEKARTRSALKDRATSLLSEARRFRLAPAPNSEWDEPQLLAVLRRASAVAQEVDTYPGENELGELHSRRREVLNQLSTARRRSQATRNAIRDVSGFGNAVTIQREKLALAEHLHLDSIAEICPICDSPSEKGREMARTLSATLAKVREEAAAVDRVRPRLIERDGVLDREIEDLKSELRRIDDQIKTWVQQSEETKRQATIAQARSYLLGKISYFLETSADLEVKPARDLKVLRSEIEELEAQVDIEARRIRLRRAESKISEFATEAFGQLPTVEPCIGAELDFSASKPEVTVVEAETEAVHRLPDVGSDQNYLAVHIALSFALQRFLGRVESPVPGLLVLDQISRPYFPTSNESDEEEVSGEGGEDVQAMREHLDFLFEETARRRGLQVLLIEHAYFSDDPRFVDATIERWSQSSGLALIPEDWPTRPDA